MDQHRLALKEVSNNNLSMENNSFTNSVKSPTVSNNTVSDLKAESENLENQEILPSSKENHPKSLSELAAEKTAVFGISSPKPNNITSTPKAPTSTKNPTFDFAFESQEENSKPINKKLSLSEISSKSENLSFLASNLGQLKIEDSVPSENATYLQSQSITSDDQQFLECESFVSANTTLEPEEPEKTLEEKQTENANETITIEPQINDVETGNGNLTMTVDPQIKDAETRNGNLTMTVDPQIKDAETGNGNLTMTVESGDVETGSANLTMTVEPQTNDAVDGNLNEIVDIENVEIKVETVPDEFPAPDMNRTMDVVKISDTFVEEKLDATFNTEAVENENYDLKNVATTIESASANVTFDHHEISDDKNESDDKIMSMTLECQLLEEDKPVELAANIEQIDIPVKEVEEAKEKEIVESNRVEMAEDEMMEVDDDAFDSEAATVKIEYSHDSEFDDVESAKVNRIFSEGDMFDEFKKPDIPAMKSRKSDPFAGATQFNSFENEEFKSSAGFNFAATDFDFLDQFGAQTSTINDIRNSVLLNFDPLLKKPFEVNENNNIKNQLKTTKLSITKEESESNNELELDLKVQTEEPTSITNNNPATIEEENYTENSIDIKQELSTDSIDSNNLKLNASNELEHDSQRQLDHDKMNVDAMKDFIVDSRESAKLECQDIKSNQEQEYKMADLENKFKNEVLKTEEIENKLKEAEMREEALLKRITEKDKTIAKMSSVVEAYEKAISELIAEKEKLQQNYEKQCAELKHDSEINAQHLASLEATFSDIHSKYERAKQVALELKEREDFLLQERKTNAENLRMQEIRYDKMKSHAMAQLEIANNTLAEITRNHNAEVTKLKAILRKDEVSKASMMEQLQQKIKENEELVKICDELINGGQTS